MLEHMEVLDRVLREDHPDEQRRRQPPEQPHLTPLEPSTGRPHSLHTPTLGPSLCVSAATDRARSRLCTPPIHVLSPPDHAHF
ncbi:hypothetical protein Q1695_001850 [Nippostrongylus brasiliensis]|nr:hypothetical protein Q1695_001850 [Nippostrongylus brasiliensis]